MDYATFTDKTNTQRFINEYRDIIRYNIDHGYFHYWDGKRFAPDAGKKIFELAQLLSGEVGATRPIVYAGWAAEDTLVGQAGKNIKPLILFSFGISGAIQHTAALTDADFIIAVNKNPNATMMKMAYVAVVADANQVCSALIKGLKARIQSKSDYSD